MPADKKKGGFCIRRKKQSNLPRRALSAYNIFFRDQRGQVLEEHKLKGLTGTSAFGALGKTIAERWKKLSNEEAERYRSLAVEDKIRYERDMAIYKAQALQVHKMRNAERRLPALDASIFCDHSSAGETVQVGYSSDMSNWAAKSSQNEDHLAFPKLGQLSALPRNGYLTDATSFELLSLKNLSYAQASNGKHQPLSQKLPFHLDAQSLMCHFANAPSFLDSQLSLHSPMSNLLQQRLASIEATYERVVERQQTEQIIQSNGADQQLHWLLARQTRSATTGLLNFGQRPSAHLLNSISNPDKNLDRLAGSVVPEVNGACLDPRLSLLFQLANEALLRRQPEAQEFSESEGSMGGPNSQKFFF